MPGKGLGGYQIEQHGIGGHGQRGHQPEDAGQPHLFVEHGRCNQCQCKHQGDAGTDHGHGAGACCIAGQICQQGGQRRGYGTRPLQGAPPDQAFYRVGASRNDAASGKQQQAHGNNPFAAPVIAGNAPWQLQGGLRQPVNAHGRTHGGGAGMAGVGVAPPGAAG